MGGLGLPELRFEIPIMAYKRLSRLKRSDSWVLKDVTGSTWFKGELSRIERLLPHYRDNQARLLNDLQQIRTFKGQLCFGVAGGLVNRHLNGNTWFSGSQFIAYLRMRTCSIGATGHEAEPVYCHYGCPNKIATLEHILNDCTHMNCMMHVRHNRAQSNIMDHLAASGWTVYKDPRVVTHIDSRWRCFIPDIIAVSPDGQASLVLDVQCSFENKKMFSAKGIWPKGGNTPIRQSSKPSRSSAQ